MTASIYGKLNSLERYEKRILGNKWIIGLLILGNFLGAIIGFQYYIDVIYITDFPPYLWILIPDCPMAVFLLIGVYLQGRDQRYLNYNLLVFIQGIRGAIFTYLIVANFTSLDIEIVVIGHTFLLLQALLILPLLGNLQVSKGTIFVIFLTLFNDFMDFFGFFSLTPPTLAQLPTIQPMFSFFLVIIVGLDLLMILLGLSMHPLQKRLTRPENLAEK
ncbi:MAG: DUF1405 domain-containing protein [Candidatus Hodarchaeales archaeon]|jgi:uncharacterized membrane protein YpjA